LPPTPGKIRTAKESTVTDTTNLMNIDTDELRGEAMLVEAQADGVSAALRQAAVSGRDTSTPLFKALRSQAFQLGAIMCAMRSLATRIDLLRQAANEIEALATEPAGG